MCCRHLVKKNVGCELSEFIWKDVEVRSSSCPPTSCSIWWILLRSFLDDFESDIDACNVNNVDSDHGDPVIVYLRCLCNFSLLRYEEDDPSAACSFRRYAAILLVGSPTVLHLVFYFRVFYLYALWSHCFWQGSIYL